VTPSQSRDAASTSPIVAGAISRTSVENFKKYSPMIPHMNPMPREGAEYASNTAMGVRSSRPSV
jgi:hypothetical protein